MLTVLLIAVPFLAGLTGFGIRGKGAKAWALISSIAILAIAIGAVVVFNGSPDSLHIDIPWITQLGSRFNVGLDGMGVMLCLLTAIVFAVIFIATWHHEYKDPHRFYGLMLLSQAGLMGVFCAYDALLFYSFWELAIIPVYFLCSIWGGEKRIAVTFKFFVYTFIGSLLMLIGIIYLYFQTPGTHSFEWSDFTRLNLDASQQSWLFWLFFVAFAIKMPVFPFHTWQPDTYEQSPTPVTIVLSAVMVKMGLFGVIRWILPVLPQGVAAWSNVVMILSVVGIVYASCLAMVQTDLKKLFAYASIAHIGLMSAAVFAGNEVSMQGVLIQMFNHGIIITGLWVMVEILEQKLHTKTIGELGGIALQAPRMAIAFMIICLGNIALPLTSGFVGEFLMFSGLYRYNAWMMAVAGIAIILSAVYILGMLQKVIYGERNPLTQKITDLRLNEWAAIAIVVALILAIGIYPKPVLDLVGSTTHTLMSIIGK